jgi:hypothetical protein
VVIEAFRIVCLATLNSPANHHATTRYRIELLNSVMSAAGTTKIGSDPEPRYSPSHFDQEEAARKWNAVRERLNADDGADIDDLLLKKKK